MKTYISILRGINVSGQKIIKMTDLTTLYEGLGFQKVTSYIQSGNVVFLADDAIEIDQIHDLITEAIERRYSFQVPIQVRTLQELIKCIEANPFLSVKDLDFERLHITFLNKEPDRELLNRIDPSKYFPDRFVVDGLAIYLYCENGYGSTKLSNSFFESKLKVSATTRNLKTCNKLMLLGEELNSTLI